MKIEIKAHNLQKNDKGIYFSKTRSPISYPAEGNEHYMEIEADSYWFNHRNDVIVSAVKNYCPEKVLYDIGGGNGFVAKRLQDDGIKVVLVEPGQAGAVNAKNRGVENVVCATLEDAQFEPSSIDSAGMFDVIEHISDDVGFLSKIYTCLKKDGYLFITVPAFNLLWSNEDIEAGHYRRYSIGTLSKVLLRSGFSLEYATYIFSILPLPIFLLRSVPSWLGFDKNVNDIKKHQKEHGVGGGMARRFLQGSFKFELNMVRQSKRIWIGSSCFIIGRKVEEIE